MKITEIETHFVQSDIPLSGYGVNGWLLVEVKTDEGVTGIGESGTWAFLEASESAVRTFERYLVGTDPLRRDHHWQYLYRNSHFRGAAIMGALSAIDIALWDIAGKYFDVPIYQLLGGKTREKVRAYVHAFGKTTNELCERCTEARDMGFTAIGHLSPLLDEPRDVPYFETHAEMVERATERVERYRDAVGNGADLCIELHRRLEPHEAIALTKSIERYNPYFVEDPVRPDNFDAMERVASNVSVPIATGERLHTVEEFEMLLRREAVDFVRPDVCLAGGLTGAKKIAAVAEANYTEVVPHNPLSPISTAACVQLAACIPNFAIQEFPFHPELGRAPNETLVDTSLRHEDGYLIVPDGPGLGVELNHDALDDSFEPRNVFTRLHEDGSVVDQ